MRSEDWYPLVLQTASLADVSVTHTHTSGLLIIDAGVVRAA